MFRADRLGNSLRIKIQASIEQRHRAGIVARCRAHSLGGPMILMVLGGSVACAAGTAVAFVNRRRRERQRMKIYRRQKQAEHAVKWQAMLAASAEREASEAEPEMRIAA